MSVLKRIRSYILRSPILRDISVPSKRALGEVTDIDGYILNGHDGNRVFRFNMEGGKIGLYKYSKSTYGGTVDWHYKRYKFIGYEKQTNQSKE